MEESWVLSFYHWIYLFPVFAFINIPQDSGAWFFPRIWLIIWAAQAEMVFQKSQGSATESSSCLRAAFTREFGALCLFDIELTTFSSFEFKVGSLTSWLLSCPRLLSRKMIIWNRCWLCWGVRAGRIFWTSLFIFSPYSAVPWLGAVDWRWSFEVLF